jgi:hypothetical protein
MHVRRAVKIGRERHTKSPSFQLGKVLSEMGTMGSAEQESGAQRLVRMKNLQKKMNLRILKPSERVKGPRREKHLSMKAWTWMKTRRMAPQKHLKKDVAVLKNSVIVKLSVK